MGSRSVQAKLVPFRPIHRFSTRRYSFTATCLSCRGALITKIIVRVHHSRHAILVLQRIELRLKVSRDILHVLEELQHALVRSWHDTLRESRLSGGVAVAAEIFATV